MAKTKKETPAKVKDVSKKKKERKKTGRVDYPLDESEKIEGLPEDFDFAKHFPVKRKFWENEWEYIEHRADEAEWRCKSLRVKAKEIKELGSSKSRARLNRMKKMTKKMAELREELEAAGVDVDSLLEVESV